MTPPLHQLAIRIRSELKDVARILQRVEEGWERARRSSDDYYLDGVALNLHGFYGGGVQAAGCFTQVQAELLAFADLLEQRASR